MSAPSAMSSAVFPKVIKVVSYDPQQFSCIKFLKFGFKLPYFFFHINFLLTQIIYVEFILKK